MVDSGREASEQRDLRDLKGLCRWTGALENSCHAPRERAQGGQGLQTSPRPPANSLLFSSPHVSITDPTIPGSQVPAEHCPGKAGREESEAGSIKAPPPGAPNATKLKTEMNQAVGSVNARIFPTRVSAVLVTTFSYFPGLEG